MLALFAELNVPIAPGLDGQLAARFDEYNDSNLDPSFQVGYNPQTSSPLGRAFYLRVNYAFR